MEKPFYSIDGSGLISESAKKRLIAYVLRHPEKVSQHRSSMTGVYDGVSSASVALACITPEVMALRARITVPHEVSVVYIQPNTVVYRHRDGRLPARTSAIIMALHPTIGYAPTMFWETLESKTPEYLLGFDDLPAIVNLQEPHSLVTDAEPRFNFQLAFELPFDQLVQLWKDGKLLRPARA